CRRGGHPGSSPAGRARACGTRPRTISWRRRAMNRRAAGTRGGAGRDRRPVGPARARRTSGRPGSPCARWRSARPHCAAPSPASRLCDAGASSWVGAAYGASGHQRRGVKKIVTDTFQRVAIVNRGEPAMRLIHAVREWNVELADRNGAAPLTTIALHTAVDRNAMFVREADEAVLIGPEDPEQAFATSPYLDYTELERALRVARADAVWPGWGFVSEKADFARLCRELGIVFVGPSPEVMERLGDKIASKLLAQEGGVPMAAWSGGPVADLAAAREHAERIGYPLMIKATAGGGGRGIRRVDSPDQLDEAFERAVSEASKTAGDATVFLERAIPGGRHVEVQVVADATGDVWTLGVRDCSVQRRNQKVIEESASTALDAEQEELLRSSAARLVKAAGYVNAGTVEFLYEPNERLLSFLEVNTRLQVEHPVTEATTGIDIVKLQLHVAA